MHAHLPMIMIDVPCYNIPSLYILCNNVTTNPVSPIVAIG